MNNNYSLYINNIHKNCVLQTEFDGIEGFIGIEDNRFVVFQDFKSMYKYSKQGYIV
jgi:hypothetical protein